MEVCVGVEVRVEEPCAVEQPVVDEPHRVDGVVGLGRVFDDDGAIEAAGELFVTALVGVIPVRSCVGRGELGDERFSRRNGWLGQAGDAVHGMWHPDAMPVDRRRLRQLVLEGHSNRVAVRNPDLGSGRSAAIAPEIGLDSVAEHPRCWGGDEPVLVPSPVGATGSM